MTRIIPRLTIFVLLLSVMLVGHTLGETIRLGQTNGIYTVPVRINDAITLPFVIDSGASEVAIPTDVYLTLIRTGSIEPNDALGPGTYKLADGSIQKSDRFCCVNFALVANP